MFDRSFLFIEFSFGFIYNNRPRSAINAAHDYLDGKVKFPEVKNIILNECHTAARELDANPTAQAAARAVGQGSAVVHTLTHSLGLLFYAAATIVYDRVGLGENEEAYAEIAEEVCFYVRYFRRMAAGSRKIGQRRNLQRGIRRLAVQLPARGFSKINDLYTYEPLRIKKKKKKRAVRFLKSVSSLYIWKKLIRPYLCCQIVATIGVEGPE
ncbi:MAG: hypothetical protein LBI04_04860, partial [Treponema sp.]|nr:hypothetical protein [Treponema sp.]